jgi:hypothetical protein
MALNLHHQTAAEFAARFWAKVRAAYSAGDKNEFARLLSWVYARVQAGDLTNDQVRLSFNNAYGRNLDSAQWNSFVTNTLLPIVNRYNVMKDQTDL